MSFKPSVLITGALGGIGRALCEEFHAHGFRVIALDRREGQVTCHRYIRADIGVLATDIKAREAFTAEIRGILQEENTQLKGLVNNAAVQILGGVDQLTVEAWQETLSTNLLAPFFLVQALLPELEKARGAVVNISSIHEKLTKAGFVAYSTSKTALSGLTRAMAVDLGARVKVNAICPAAIKTPMLAAGFEGRQEAFDALHQAHPGGRIGLPEEVAHLARYLIAEAPGFLNGSCLGLDGGIAGRLHDPV
jgi:NAD(P)-dependent dehydrogenase (short-subunit alcohol dehydrogenase family)